MPTPEGLEREHTLTTAVVRYNELRGRDAFAATATDLAAAATAALVMTEVAPLTKEESLEMLALGEAIARKAADGRRLGIRSAREAGASWTQIGEALAMSKQSAWEQGRLGHAGFDDQDEAARGLTDSIDDDQSVD